MTSPKRASEIPYGTDVEAGKSYFWCSCGESSTQPFCDGSHKGTEFTLVLDGSFEDDLGSYGPGDFLLRDGSHTHSPLSKDGCLCFAVLDKPLSFTAGAARFLNPWNQLRFSMKHGLSA